ncbi:MAG: YbaN family protein [Tissierellia bacterium]|nr:YbaN family protein [Tissierellia bacterium]
MKLIFIILGFLFMGLGIIGIYLPLLPTTPFLLLAAACFGKGSDKFHNWFIKTSIYKKNLQPLVNKEGMDIKRKIRILGTITLLICISFYFMKNIFGRTVLILVLIIHYIYIIFRVKTKRGDVVD